jgi:hypothetical protein
MQSLCQKSIVSLNNISLSNEDNNYKAKNLMNPVEIDKTPILLCGLDTICRAVEWL